MRNLIKTAKCLILGNGLSRINKLNKIQNFDGDIWACNRAYLEYKTFEPNKLKVIVSVHNDEAVKALEFKKTNNLDYEILTQSPTSPEIKSLNTYHGFSSGSEAIIESINRGYKEIWLVGFCHSHGDKECIYTKGLVTDNFFKQWNYIIDTIKPECKFHFL